MSLKKLGERNYLLLSEGARTTGNYVDAFHYAYERLYVDEAEQLMRFCEWCDEDIVNRGWGELNYELRFRQFLEHEEKEQKAWNDMLANAQAKGALVEDSTDAPITDELTEVMPQTPEIAQPAPAKKRRAKITDEIIAAIRADLAAGIKQSEIAKSRDVDSATVSDIKNNRGRFAPKTAQP